MSKQGLQMTKLLNVGQGLSFVDSDNMVIYDAGGSISEQKFISKLPITLGKKYTVIVSHWHFDHYKYLRKMIELDLIDVIYSNERFYQGKRLREMSSLAEAKGIKIIIVASKQVIPGKPYTIIPSPEVRGNLNKSSLLAIKDISYPDWLLTGDQHDYNIENMLKTAFTTKTDFKNLQVPHHGSKHSNDPFKIKMIRSIDRQFVSYKTVNRFKHPDAGTILKYESVYGKDVEHITE